MFFQTYIVRKSRIILLVSSLLILFNSFFSQENEARLINSNTKTEISASYLFLNLPVEPTHYRTEKPQSFSFDRIDKAEEVHHSLVKMQFKEVISKADRYDGLVRLQFFLLTQFSTST